LCGGNSGIDFLSLEDTDEVNAWLFDSENDVEDSQIIGIMPKVEYERSLPFIIPHHIWKTYGDPAAKENEYRYVHSGEDEHQQWPSIRHYIGEQVVQMEVNAAIHKPRPINEPHTETTLPNANRSNFELSDNTWKGLKDIVKQRTNSATIADEAIGLFQRTLESQASAKTQAGAAIPTPEQGLSLEESLYTDPTKFGTQVDAEKMMQTKNLWDIIKSYIEFEGKATDISEKIVQVFRNAWEERSRGQKRQREN